MGEVKVNLIMDQIGGEMEADLPDDVSIKDLVPGILGQIDELKEADPSVWGLYNKSRQFRYNPDDTLASRETAEGEKLGLIPSPVAGRTPGRRSQGV
jgi:hypothetical protein